MKLNEKYVNLKIKLPVVLSAEDFYFGIAENCNLGRGTIDENWRTKGRTALCSYRGEGELGGASNCQNCECLSLAGLLGL